MSNIVQKIDISDDLGGNVGYAQTLPPIRGWNIVSYRGVEYYANVSNGSTVKLYTSTPQGMVLAGDVSKHEVTRCL